MSGRQSVLWVVGVCLLAAIGYVLLRDEPDLQPAVTVPVAPVKVEREIQPEPPTQSPVPAEALDRSSKPKLIPAAVSIDASHEVIVAVLNNVSPTLIQWMVSEELLRKWVILIDQIADGTLSTKHLPIAYEMAPFAINGTKELAQISPENYSRATPLVAAFTKIEPEILVAYYRLWQPLLEKAYGELGKGGNFDDRVMQALRQLQSVPVAPLNADIQARPVMYKYVEPSLEKAPALHKWMWRLGPKNQSDIKSYLTQVKLALYRQP
ncbi:DUF3014 domain-containing protein [Simiduia aestuariiviva]|uniref:DUF3014 domain-containing protein n=1 Tax=Simiduia aestuariiviva TaxID=1510459 RepID=A0A839US63_9GAMM|nr:DUF3014 domain-containing protein [Simiduia aestuariiviva]MBB3168225.1 hypothetical protein [Simiduia aestuariiviva]